MDAIFDLNYNVNDLENAKKLLEELSLSVQNEEGVLSGGKKLGMGALALRKLLETRISFGNPLGQLRKLSQKDYAGISKKVFSDGEAEFLPKFHYYYLVLPVLMQPGRGVSFRRLECKLDFAPKGNNEPIVHSIFPTSEWHEVLRWGGQMRLGLSGDLKWFAGIFLPPNTNQDSLAPSLKELIVSNKMTPYIEVPKFSFSLGRANISATGVGGSWCFWRVDKPVLKEMQTINFAIVFKVPKSVKSIELNSFVIVEPNFEWLSNSLRDVIQYLEHKWKNYFALDDDQRQGPDRLPIGDHEVWDIKLPK